MSETNRVDSLPQQRPNDGEPRRNLLKGRREMAHLELELAIRDAQITELKNHTALLWAAIFCIVVVWSLRELLRG